MNKTEKLKRYVERKTRHEKKRAAERKLLKTLSREQIFEHKKAIKKRVMKQEAVAHARAEERKRVHLSTLERI